MSKDESVNVEVGYIELVGLVNSLTTKLAELGTMQENLSAKVVEMGTMQENVSGKVFEERTYDIGEGEAWKFNMKRMADEYQHESLESIRRNRTHIDKVVTDQQQNDNFKQNVANQALQNAVETANMVSKQAVRHGDIAIDRQWNLDEVAGFAQKVLSGIQDPAVAAAMAAAIAKSMLGKDA